MLLYYLITVVHVLVCVILILVVLLQSGKGADLAGAFGGGATQTAFGSRGPASVLSKATTIAAIVFMLTSISLSVMGTKTEAKSILDTTKGTKASKPIAPPAAVKPQAQPPSPEEIKKLQQEIEAKQNQGATGTQSPASPRIQAAPTPAGKADESKPPAEGAKPSSGKKP